jgi:DNA-binding CsgD family transcriptional regulator/tetratricopeptide (TPR) repeat protein
MLVGRSSETATISRLLADARQGRSAALVIRGEAGVGKSALLDYAAIEAGGFTVLRSVGVEGEAELAYAALHQILRPAFDRIPQLPPPQAAALQAAFALTDETVDERFRVSLGVLGLLSEVAEETPVLCLVDDAQWLDQASADAMLFAARRLQAESVVLLFGVRDSDERPFEARGVDELRLSSLSVGDSRRLVGDRLGSAVASGVVEWLVDNARGNPLALVELPATLTQPQLAGLDPIARRLAAPTTVEQVYLDRVNALPETTRRLLLLAAAEETGARAPIERAAREQGLDVSDLAPAEGAGLIRVESDRLEFRHPLVRSAVYRSVSFTDREAAHRILAVASAEEGNPDRAAWHRAAATVGADEDVARELESTAERARLRSGHAAAASALERAAELSADDASRGRRLVAAARAAWPAGQPERAQALLDRALPLVDDSRLQSEIDSIRGVILWRCGSLPDAYETLIAGAERVAPLDQPRALEILADAALAAWDAGDYDRLAYIGESAAALEVQDGHRLLADVLVAAVDLSRSKPVADMDRLTDLLNRAVEVDDTRVVVWSAIAAELAGQEELERRLVDRSETLARQTSAVDRLIVVLESSAVQGFLAGDLSVTAEATEGLQLALEVGLPNAANLHRAALSWIAAVQGHADECRRLAATVIETARPNGHGIALAIAEWAIALLDLATGHPEESVARLTNLRSAPAGIGHPFYVIASAPDLIEASVRSGRRDIADAALEPLAAAGGDGAAPWLRAYVARCRGLLADGSAAEAHFLEALRLHSLGTNPLDRARSELLYGEFLRRERRRGDARDQLRKALSTFERLRAEPWAERARTELRATGETARKRDPSTFDDLTPQELQIARLVAEGSSNKEVAAQLFLSPRTVEYHLRKVFAKLGIVSRSELIRNGVVRVDEAAALS